MLDIARELGAKVSDLKNGTVVINAAGALKHRLPSGLSSSIRGSILFASAILARKGIAEIPQPGGDTIGRRRVDTHLLVFRAMGARIRSRRDKTKSEGDYSTYILTAPSNGMHGATVYLDEASVTATENALIVASDAHGPTVIVNAASEPHVQGLCNFLQAIGTRVEGTGSNILTIVPRDRKFKPEKIEHTVGCDHIEAGSFIGLAAATGSSLTISNVNTGMLRMILMQFWRLGVSTSVDAESGRVRVDSSRPLRIRKDTGDSIPRLEDSPWPGMPADLTSIMLVTATQAKGTCLIHEKMFESRLFFVDTLINMGAQVVLCDPHRAVVSGPSRLHGSTITSPDIRAGMALLIAALAARGTSLIHNVRQIDRGYERIDERLKAIGAKISRIEQRRKTSIQSDW
jgi:UDP-N-acetylglucosamine 1-carboxyvinyltransferase